MARLGSLRTLVNIGRKKRIQQQEQSKKDIRSLRTHLNEAIRIRQTYQQMRIKTAQKRTGLNESLNRLEQRPRSARTREELEARLSAADAQHQNAALYEKEAQRFIDSFQRQLAKAQQKLSQHSKSRLTALRKMWVSKQIRLVTANQKDKTGQSVRKRLKQFKKTTGKKTNNS